MKFLEKIKWILGILLVFFLVLMTNLIDRNNFVQVRSSITTIYEDRLIASDLILKMMQEVHQKELQVLREDTAQSPLVDDSFEQLIAVYDNTRLTKDEARTFGKLQNNLKRFTDQESREVSNSEQLLQGLEKIRGNLKDLSAIQLHEGKNQMLISRRAVETIELFTNIAIYILIVLAVFIQVIILYEPRRKKKKKDLDRS